jgi:spore coat polysaccharide biosynthesis protein SpsF
MSSARLPGKALRDIEGRPMLGRIVDRLRRVAADGVDLVIATSGQATDDAIAAFAVDEDIEVFRGALGDVAGRALACARQHEFEYLVRISGDSPFICPRLVCQAIGLAKAQGPDIVTNLFPRTFPPGMSVEAISTASLAAICEDGLSAEEQEHVTLRYYRRPDEFAVVNFTAESDDPPPVALTVDTERDLAKAAWIVRQLGAGVERASRRQIVDLALRWQADQPAAIH